MVLIMLKLIIACFIFIALIKPSMQIKGCHKCPQNQIWATEGFDCQTCDNEKCVRCALIKKPGCYCDEYSVHLNGNSNTCVRRENCPVCIPTSTNNCGCATNSWPYLFETLE